MVKGRRENPVPASMLRQRPHESFHPGAGRYLLEGLILLMVAKIREEKKGSRKCCVKASDTDQQRKKEIKETGSFISRNSLCKSESAPYEGEGA